MKKRPRLNVVIATCYFTYAGVALALLVVVVAIGSQAAKSCSEALVGLAIALTSPVPMLLVGVSFYRGSRRANVLAVALVLFHALTFALQGQIAGGMPIGQLSGPRSVFYYLCSSQTYYFPGSVFMAIVSLVVAFVLRLERRSHL